ncbi:MAG: hypothetical protein AAFY71_21350 [Bacteroidota bacterium]
MKRYIPFLLVVSLLIAACGNNAINPNEPENPFDSIVFPEDTIAPTQIDTASIVGLHHYIFSVSCAVPGCHDGSFEPDFRTVQSAYSSLVYHPVIKNTVDEAYEYRVKPASLNESWFYNRVTTDDQTLGRMPLYDNPLEEWKLQAIRDWIMDGAKDQFGQDASLPNRQPTFKSLAAFQDFNGFEVRVDSFRDTTYAPFGMRYGLASTVWFKLEDDSTAEAEFQNFRVKTATGQQNLQVFTPENEFTAQYSSAGKTVLDFYEDGSSETFHWFISFNANRLTLNDLTLFRLYLNDGDHQNDLEFPSNGSPIESKAYMAAYIVP